MNDLFGSVAVFLIWGIAMTYVTVLRKKLVREVDKANTIEKKIMFATLHFGTVITQCLLLGILSLVLSNIYF